MQEKIDEIYTCGLDDEGAFTPSRTVGMQMYICEHQLKCAENPKGLLNIACDDMKKMIAEYVRTKLHSDHTADISRVAVGTPVFPDDAEARRLGRAIRNG